ncbi:unnamed protein product [Prunus armeniaca]
MSTGPPLEGISSSATLPIVLVFLVSICGLVLCMMNVWVLDCASTSGVVGLSLFQGRLCRFFGFVMSSKRELGAGPIIVGLQKCWA